MVYIIYKSRDLLTKGEYDNGKPHENGGRKAVDLTEFERKNPMVARLPNTYLF